MAKTHITDLGVLQNLTVGGTSAVTGNSTVTGNKTVGGTLAVTGATALAGALSLTVPLTKTNANVSLKRFVQIIKLGPVDAPLANTKTYAAWAVPLRAATITGISALCGVAIGTGTHTLKVLKGSSSGNTILSTASVDPALLVANTVTPLTLTATAADKGLTAAQGAYIELITGTQGTAGENYAVAVEYELTDV